MWKPPYSQGVNDWLLSSNTYVHTRTVASTGVHTYVHSLLFYAQILGMSPLNAMDRILEVLQLISMCMRKCVFEGEGERGVRGRQRERR